MASWPTEEAPRSSDRTWYLFRSSSVLSAGMRQALEFAPAAMSESLPDIPAGPGGMERVRLGHSDVYVTRLMLGCAPLAGMYAPVEDKRPKPFSRPLGTRGSAPLTPPPSTGWDCRKNVSAPSWPIERSARRWSRQKSATCSSTPTTESRVGTSSTEHPVEGSWTTTRKTVSADPWRRASSA